MSRPRVLVADDHPGVSKAVCRLLALECDVVGSVADGGAVPSVAGAAATGSAAAGVRSVLLPSRRSLTR